MAWKVEGSCFIQAGGKAVAGGLATGGVAAPAAGGHPLPPIAGCVGVDGDQANVALAKFLAPVRNNAFFELEKCTSISLSIFLLSIYCTIYAMYFTSVFATFPRQIYAIFATFPSISSFIQE